MTVYKLIDRLKKLAGNEPDKPVLVEGNKTVSRKELIEYSQRVAAFILSKKADTNIFLPIILPDSIDYIIALFGIWLTGNAAVHLNDKYPRERIDYIVSHCDAPFVIDKPFMQEVHLCKPAEVMIERTPQSYLSMFYTSGSTGSPKGVLHTDRSLMEGMFRNKGWVEDDVFAWIPPMSFVVIVKLLHALYLGAEIHIVPDSVKKDAVMLREYLIKNRITAMYMSPSLIKLIDTDGTFLKVVQVGSERITNLYSDKFQFIADYGQTEAGGNVCNFMIDRLYSNTPLGRISDGLEALIVDENGDEVPEGGEGELCIKGITLPVYYKEPEQTAEMMRGGMLHTGDIFKQLPSGDLLFIERKDRMVKINGQRVEPGEIEAVMCRQLSVTHAVVKGFTSADNVRQFLVGYYLASHSFDDGYIREKLLKELPDYMVPASFVKIDKLPLLPNGKIDYKSLKEPVLKAGGYAKPQNELEQKLFQLASSIFGHEQFDVTTNLISIGLTSLSAMELSRAIYDAFNIQVNSADILRLAKIRNIVNYFSKALAVEKREDCETREFYPITENQRGLYIEWEKNRGTIQYNCPFAYKVRDVSIEQLKKALKKVVNGHPSLKTSFAIIDGNIVQQRNDGKKIEISVVELDGEPSDEFFQDCVRPFDLLSDELCRIEIYTFSSSVYLFIDIHHIIFDGFSSRILLNDLEKAMEGGDIELEKYTSFDVAVDEKKWMNSDEFKRCEQYFDKLAHDAIAASYPHSILPDSEQSAARTLKIAVKGDAVTRFCREECVTPGSYFLTVVTQVLHRILREDRLLTASVTNGRYAAKMESVTGMFVKTFPVVSSVSDCPLAETVKAMQEQYINSQTNALYPYTFFVKKHKKYAKIMYAYQDGVLGNPCNQNIFDAADFRLSNMHIKMPIIFQVYSEGDGFIVKAEYDTAYYSRKDIERLLDAVKYFAENAMNYKVPCCNIPMMSQESEKKLVELGGGSDISFDASQTLIDLFERQAAETPDAAAVIFGNRIYTYREADDFTNRMAVKLVRLGVKKETAVGVMIERSEWMVLYPLAVMKAGGAYMPLDYKFPQERLDFMCRDAGVNIILSDANLVQQSMPDYTGTVLTQADFDDLNEVTKQETAQLPKAAPENMFVILYTSGSTGKPKGCILEHRNIVNFCYWYADAVKMTRNDHCLSCAQFGFDAHMIDIYPALTHGAAAYILPSELMTDISGMNDYMEKNNITLTFLTTQIGYLFCTGVANHSLRLLCMGGEKQPPMHKPHFRFFHCYGPTECTLFTTVYDVQGGYGSFYIGRPLSGYRLYVVDKYMNLIPKGMPGELIVAGIGVSRGYLNRPELNEEKFITFRGSRAYRTGDLVRWTEDGNIDFVGRADNLVKINGLRIELGEIEACASEYPGIQTVCADVKNIAGSQKLVCYYSEKQDKNVVVEQLKLYLEKSLPDFMVPQLYVKLEKLPLTSNGKTDRGALPVPELKEEKTVIPANSTERELLDIARNLLENKNFGVTANLREFGMDSFLSIEFALRIRQKMKFAIDSKEIIRTPVIRQIAKHFNADGYAAGTDTVYPRRKYYPLTENQRGLYFEWKMNRAALQYNIPMVVKYACYDAYKLKEAVCAAVNAHSYIKTKIVTAHGEKMLLRRDDAEVNVTIEAVDGEPDVRFFQSKVKPFDIENDGLYRLTIYKTVNSVYLFMDIHHIIFDGLSVKIFLEDLQKAYWGETLNKEVYTAFENSLDEKNIIYSDKYEKAEERFSSLLSGAVAAVYPLSYNIEGQPKPGLIDVDIPSGEINAFCINNGVTAEGFFLTAVMQVLHRVTGNEKLMLASVYHGRQDERMDIVGMFVKTLAVVSRMEKNISMKDAVYEIYNQLIDTQAYSFYPYSKIVENFGIRADILYAYQKGVMDAIDSGCGARVINLQLDTVKFPILITVCTLKNGDYTIRIEYDSHSYSAADMYIFGDMIRHFALKAAVAEDPCSSIPLLDEEAAINIIELGKGKTLHYDSSETFISLFCAQAHKTPDALAVEDECSSLTYAQLDAQSNILAHQLILNGVLPNDFVAVKLPRRKEYAVAVLAIHKAGAAYVPIDENNPKERIEYILEDSEAKFIITPETLNVESIDESYINMSTPDGYAYMIYTSGSTGKPKGVILHHRGLRSYIASMIETLELTDKDRISLHRPFSFDAHIQDFYPVLTLGGSIHIMPESIRRDLAGIRKFIIAHKITGGSYTTSLGALLLDRYTLPLRYMTCTGEKMTGIASKDYSIYNGYGPTECTDLISIFKLDMNCEYRDIPIGRPMANSYCFIVDQYGCLLPQGVPGELCFAGPQVGYGYWKLPDLTHRSFADCPFVSGERMYYTGDLCRWNAEGNLEYLGRIDNQMKFRGFRIEPGEIEAEGRKIPGVEQAAVSLKEVNKKEHLVFYFTLKEGAVLTAANIKEALGKTSLAEYMIPEIYEQIDEMPTTVSGKIDRKSLPAPAGTSDNVVMTVPETQTEQELLDIAKELLGKTNFGVTDNLIANGMHSLEAMDFSDRISQNVYIDISSEDILKTPTIRQIAEKLSINENISTEVLSPKRKYYPIMENQRGLIFEWENNSEALQYNMPVVVKYTDCDENKLKQAAVAVFDAHPYLKAKIVTVNGEDVLLRRDDANVNITITSMDKEPDVSFFQGRVKPFDIKSDELYRVEIYKTLNSVYLFRDIHHIIFDGLSEKFFWEDLDKAYNGEKIAKEKYTAFDYALNEREIVYTDRYRMAEERFSQLFSGAEAAIYPLSDGVEEKSKPRFIVIDVPMDKINVFCDKNGFTPNSFFLTAVTQVLHRITGIKKLVIASICSGRGTNTQMRNAIGMFVKTLPVVSRIHENDISMREAVCAVHNQFIDTQSDSFYSYTKIVEKFGIRADVMFVYQSAKMDAMSNKQNAEVIHLELDTVKFPIVITVSESKNNTYSLSIEYNSGRYSAADMEQLSDSIVNFLFNSISCDKLESASIVSRKEQNELILLGKGETIEYDDRLTFVSMFMKQANVQPDATAVVDVDGFYTYEELNVSSNAIAWKLIELKVLPDSLVGIMLPRRKEFIAAVIGVQKAGCAYVPMDSEYPNDRLKYMMEDSGAKVLLTTNDIFEKRQTDEWLHAQEIVLVEEIIKDKCLTDINLAGPDTPAYIIYTSGSTGRPKGVLICHRSISACAAWNTLTFGLAPGKRNLHQPSFSFDASTFDLFYPLWAGAAVYLADEKLSCDLNALANYIVENIITGMTMSTAVGMALLNDYDLPVEYIMLGGETFFPVKKTKVRLYNGYGPTEFTVCSSFHLVDQEKDIKIPIGRPVPNSYSFICDITGNLLQKGMTGELCLSGRQMAEGYWNCEQLSGEKFCECKFMPGQKMYRTGDLARYNAENELEYIGRIDNQIKLNGYRIEPGEIESAAIKFDGISNAAAVVKEKGGMKHLCLYYTADREVGKEEFRAYLLSKLAKYMVPAVYTKLDALPLTLNGKIDRMSLPAFDDMDDLIEMTAPNTQAEHELFRIVKDLLHTDNFGVTTDLISLNMNSILLMRLASGISQKMNINITSNDIMRMPTIRQIAKHCDGCSFADGPVKRPKRKYYPLTENQKGLYFECEMNRGALQYNIPMVVKYTNHDARKLRDAVASVINAHPYIKTKLVTVDGEIMLLRRDDADVNVMYHVVDGELDTGFFQEKVKPFDLRCDELYRVQIYEALDAVYLFMDIHHIIFDGFSVNLFMEELENAYRGKALKKETYTAFDSALNDQDIIYSDENEKAEERFRLLLSSAEAAVYPFSYNVEKKPYPRFVSTDIPVDEISAFCNNNRVTPNSFFLTVVMQVLHRVTRSEKLMIAAAYNGRSDNRMDIMGMFVKTLPVVSRAGRNISMKAAVSEIHNQFIDTTGCSFYPYRKIIEKFGIRADIMYAYQEGVMDKTAGQQDAEVITLQLDRPKFPMMIAVFKQDIKWRIQIEYDSSRYNESDMDSLLSALSHYAVNSINSKNISTVPLLGETQLNELKSMAKGKTLEYDKSLTLVDIIVRQAVLSPNDTAVVFRNKKYTYREIDVITTRLAVYLQKKYNIAREQAVGVMIERSELMVIYPVAVMKAGAAYIPLDYNFPPERLKFMCDDANVNLILSEGDKVRVAMHDYKGEVYLAEEIVNLPDDMELNTERAAKRDNMFVILYTSGSAGEPKGVVLEHHSMVNFCHWYVDEFDVTKDDRVAAYANFGFDAHMMDVYPAFLAGAAVYILNDDIRMNLFDVEKYIRENELTIAFMTTVIGRKFASDYTNHKLRLLSVGGEELTPIAKPDFRFYNCYGPTECTIYATAYNVEKDYTGRLIGVPLANYSLYIVDGSMQMVPKGAVGELVIAGEGVGRGYLNRPDITPGKFIRFMGQKAYRTGDLARWSDNGNIEYCGREDSQIKLHGLRIELGEIETTISEFDGIDSCAAAVKEINGEKLLCCYFTGRLKIESGKLREYLKRSLAEFMVPKLYMQLETMPLTPNGKIDRKLLPVPQVNIIAEYEAAHTSYEKLFCDIFARIFKKDKVGINDNYFQNGMTSYSGMNVVAEAKRAGIEIRYEDLFDNPTPKQLADYVSKKKIKEEALLNDECITDFDYSKIQHVLDNNNLQHFVTGKQTRIENVLLAGAGGFLGIHVLYELLNSDKDIHVYCLIRHKDGNSAESRLKNLFYYYFNINIFEEYGSRFSVMDNDIRDARSLEAIDVSVDTVINCAALVKHFSNTSDIVDVNVGGVENLIEFCIKADATLIQISTSSVGEMQNTDGGRQPVILTEQMLYIGQILKNKYCRSKFMAEQKILYNIAENGLKAKIIRVGNLSPRASDGKFQINYEANSSMGRLNAYNILNSVSYEMLNKPVEFSPIDDVAKTVVLLAQSPSECCLFHSYNPHCMIMADVIAAMNMEGMTIHAIEENEFERLVDDTMKTGDDIQFLIGLVAYQNKNKNMVMTELDNNYTMQVLYRMGFYWSESTGGYVRKFVRLLKKEGFFKIDFP